MGCVISCFEPENANVREYKSNKKFPVTLRHQQHCTGLCCNSRGPGCCLCIVLYINRNQYKVKQGCGMEEFIMRAPQQFRTEAGNFLLVFSFSEMVDLLQTVFAILKNRHDSYVLALWKRKRWGEKIYLLSSRYCLGAEWSSWVPVCSREPEILFATCKKSLRVK